MSADVIPEDNTALVKSKLFFRSCVDEGKATTQTFTYLLYQQSQELHEII